MANTSISNKELSQAMMEEFLRQMETGFLDHKTKWDSNHDFKRAVLAALGKVSITRVFCFDVGLRSTSRFAALMTIIDAMGKTGITYAAQEPNYDNFDKEFLRHYNYSIADYPEGIYHVDNNTFVFCANPSKETVTFISQGPQLAMLIVQDTTSVLGIFANFESQVVTLTGDPGTWTLYRRRASLGRHRFGVGTIAEWKPSLDQWLAIIHTHPEAFSLPYTRLDEEVTEDLLRGILRDSPSDEGTLMQLADYYVKKDRKKEAEVIFRGLLTQSIGNRGIYHVQTLSCLGDIYNSFKTSDPKKAEPLLRAVLRGQQEALGLDNSTTSSVAYWLGEILFRQEKYVESEDALEKALIYLKRVPVEKRITDFRASPVFTMLLKIKLELANQAKQRGDNATYEAKLIEGNKLTEEIPIPAT